MTFKASLLSHSHNIALWEWCLILFAATVMCIKSTIGHSGTGIMGFCNYIKAQALLIYAAIAVAGDKADTWRRLCPKCLSCLSVNSYLMFFYS